MSANLNTYFAFAKKWHHFPGVAFGLQQSTLAGQVAVSRLSDSQLAHLESHIGSYLKETAPELSGACDNFERFARRLAFWICAIQRQSGIPLSEKFLVQTVSSPDAESMLFDMAVPVIRQKAAIHAMSWLAETVEKAFTEFQDRVPDVDEIQESLEKIHNKLKEFAEPGINKHLIVLSANRLDIPVTRINNRIAVLGTGRYTRWFDSTVTDKTSLFGVNIASNKEMTATLLRAMGLPGAEQERVETPEEAASAAEKLGYPVVIKPADRERGIGVSADLRDPVAVALAFENARGVSDHVLVEKFCEGFTHRLTVQQDELIRVTRRIAGGVVGDGQHTVAELVARWNDQTDNQRRSRRLGRVLLELDTEAEGMLMQQQIDRHFVPEAGHYVRLRRRDNINAGGSNEYLELSDVHPDNARLAIDAARLLRLDFAGIDLIMNDIGKSWLETKALICEVNAKPQMGDGRNEHIYDRVLQRLMGGNYRIPAHLIICPSAVTTQGRLAEELSRSSGQTGASCIEGIWIGGQRVSTGFENSFQAARALLIRSEIECAYCIMLPSEITKLGLPSNKWQEVRVYFREKLEESEKSLLNQIRQILHGHVSEPPAQSKKSADHAKGRVES